MTLGIARKNKTASSLAAGTPHAVPVSTIALTGIEPSSDSNSRRDRPNIISRGRRQLAAGPECSGREFESLLGYAIPLFPTLAYNPQRFGTPGLNGLRTLREL